MTRLSSPTMKPTSLADLLFIVAWTTSAAGCTTDDKNASTGPAGNDASDGTGATSTEPSGSASSTGAMDTAPPGTTSPSTATTASGEETTGNATVADGETTTGGDETTTGGDGTCELVGQLFFECYMGAEGYTAQEYASGCVSEIAYYTDASARCGELLTDWYACLSRLDCEALMTETECGDEDAVFTKMCV